MTFNKIKHGLWMRRKPFRPVKRPIECTGCAMADGPICRRYKRRVTWPCNHIIKHWQMTVELLKLYQHQRKEGR